MTAGLDEDGIIRLVVVVACLGALALGAAFMLWRRERAVGQPTGEAIADVAVVAPGVVGETHAGPAASVEMLGNTPAVAPAVAIEALAPAPIAPWPIDVAATVPPVETIMPSGGGMSRVELFPSGARFAHVLVDDAAHRADIAVVEPPAQREISVAEDAGLMIEVMERPALADVLAIEAVPDVLPVRRRPKTASELAEAGQTPEGLLERAHSLLAAGSDDEAKVQLQACARLASRLKVPAVEAVARLELGDLCQAHGDMTTACEHWQLARSLYGELQKLDEKAGIIKRMEKAGCPTDWVLTKF